MYAGEESKCAFIRCEHPSAGRGKCIQGVHLCAEHLDEDSIQFNAMYADIKTKNINLLEKLRETSKATSESLFQLNNNRADAADLFDAIFERVQECRQKVLGSIDSKIGRIEENSTELKLVESQEVGVSEAEASDDLVRGFKLRTELQKTLEGIQLQEYVTKSGDTMVELLQRLQQKVSMLASDVESGDCRTIKSNLRKDMERKVIDVYPISDYNSHIAVCSKTSGFFYSHKGLSSSPSGDGSELPDLCVLLVQIIKSKKEVSEIGISYFSAELSHLAKLVIKSSDTELVAVDCVSHLQRILFLGKSLTVTDLSGTKLRTVESSDTHLDMCHDMEKLYILVKKGVIRILSLDTLNVQSTLKLQQDLGFDSISAGTGRNRVFLASKSVVCTLQVNQNHMQICFGFNKNASFSFADIGFGLFAAVTEESTLKIIDNDGNEHRKIELISYHDTDSNIYCRDLSSMRSVVPNCGTSCKLFVYYCCVCSTRASLVCYTIY